MKKAKLLMCVLSTLLLLLAAIPAFAQSNSRPFSEFESEIKQAKGRNEIEKIMKKNGWVPVNLKHDKTEVTGGSEVSTMATSVGPADLDVTMYGFRNQTSTELAVYGEYSWLNVKCLDTNKVASYDVMGLDWQDTSLTLLSVKTNSASLSYRGTNPFQRSLVFNAYDPTVSGPFCTHMGATGWMTLKIPAGSTGNIFQFNLKFDHTYAVTTTSGTWSAGIAWDSGLKGNVSYTVQLQNTEASWSKGAFYSCEWPCG
jgi:hypothetical protein